MLGYGPLSQDFLNLVNFQLESAKLCLSQHSWDLFKRLILLVILLRIKMLLELSWSASDNSILGCVEGLEILFQQE